MCYIFFMHVSLSMSMSMSMSVYRPTLEAVRSGQSVGGRYLCHH